MKQRLDPFVLELYQRMIAIPIIRVAIHLGIFDAIYGSERGCASIEELTTRIAYDKEVVLLDRRLQFLVAAGLLTHNSSDYSLTPTGSSLRTGQPSCDFFILMHDEVLLPAEHTIRFWEAHASDDVPLAERSHTHNLSTFKDGQEGKTFFDMLDSDPARLQRFHNGMRSMEALHPWIVLDYGKLYEEHKNLDGAFLVDMGGGKGDFVLALLRRFPNIRPDKIVLQDLPNVIRDAEVEKRLYGFALEENNFLTHRQPIRGACVYHIRACLHDYSDKISIRILENVAAAMSLRSRLVLSENVMPEEPDLGDSTRYLDMSLSIFGGKCRTRAEFQSILEASGLRLCRVTQIGNDPWCSIESVLKDSPLLDVEEA